MAEIIKTVIDVDINTSGAAAELRSLQQQINAFNLTLNKGQLEQGQASRVFAEGLRNSINTGGFFRAELVKMQTAAGALDSTLRKGQGTLGQFFSASFNKKGGMAAEVFALAAERARTMQTQFIATAKASKGMQEALAVRPLTAFSADAAVSAQRMQILNSMFKQGTTGLINFGKNVQWTGRQLMVGFTIPLTIFGTTAGRVFSDLEKQAVNFKKVYGDIFTTPAELEENFKAVQGLSREFTKYGIAAKDTLGLAAQAAAAGRQNTDLTDAVRESTRLATLGQMDQNAALETTISLQSAFRLSGQELADTINFLNMVENQTVVSLQDIAAAIPRVAPVIKGLGGDVKDLTVFLAAMQEGGVSAEQGANALKSGLGSLINPTKAATDVLSGFKINLDSIIQTNRGDLMGTVTAFSDALSTLDEFSRQQALESIFGKFQYARLGALFENISREGSQAQQVISTLGYSTEQLAKSAEKELTTVEQAFSTQLTGAIERLKISIAPLGEIFVKMAIPLVNMVTKMVESFNRLPEGVKNIAALAAALGGVLLPAATMIFGLFANLIGTFAKFSHSMGMFGVTLLRKGPLAAIKSLTQSANYLSLSEIDAANAARQLGSATELANAALLSQVGSANSADVAIKNLTNSYRVLISEQTRASQAQPFLFGTGQGASNLGNKNAAASVATTMATRGKSRIKSVGLNKGGSVFTPDNGNTVPGAGNTDTVPAMLTPGEFVVNKESTKNNLGLLHAINAQRLNVGGKVKNGIQYAMSGFKIGNIPGYSAATNSVAAKLARAGQAAVGRTRGAAPRISDEATQLKNNFVYLLNPTNNQQLTGVRTMAGFDKRGVPLDVLKQDMVSEDGLWMIDALAKGNWKKDAYKSTLENNFANIATKYPGKEIRFLDSAGLERVQPLLGKPEYENVQFVSVKDLQNKDLLDNLTPDHLDRLMTDATQVSRELKTSKSRGTTTLKDVYRGIPGMESYTKILTNWRGERKPKGKHGAHMYNMGGKVSGVQYFGTNIAQRVVQDVLKMKSHIYRHRAHGGNPAEFQKETMLKSFFDIEDKFARVNKLVKFGFSPKEAGQLSKMNYEDALKTEIVKNKAFYAPGWGGGTTAASSGIYNLFQQQLKNIADSGINPETIKRLSTQRGIGFGKIPPKKLVKVAKMLNTKEYRYILEGSIPYTREHAEFTSKVYSEFIKNLPENSVEAKTLIKVRDELLKDSKLSSQDYLENVVKERIKGAHSVSGDPKDIDKLFKNITSNSTAQEISETILNVDNLLLEGAKFKDKNKKTKLKFRDQEVKGKKHTALNSFISAFNISAWNKGGMIPGMQYANVGKIIAAMSKTKGRNESIDNLSNLSNEVKTKILSGQIKKRSDFTSRSDRALFDNSTNMALSNPSKDDLLDLLTTDHSNLLSNSHLYSIALNKNADDDVLNLLATQFKNRLRYAKPEELGDYLNQTAKIIQDRGIKLNKGGMIPGAQYLNIGGRLGKAIFERGKVGKPAIINQSGLTPKSMDLVEDLVRGGMKIDDAISYAKIMQQKNISVDLQSAVGRVKSIDDVVARKYDFWKSQNQWAVYNPKYKDVKEKALEKIKKETFDKEFKRMSSGKPSLIDEYNQFNKGGMIPGYNIGGLFGKGLFHAGNIKGNLQARGLGSRGSGFYTTESLQSAKIFKDSFNTPSLYKLGFSDDQIKLIESGKVKTYEHSNPIHRKKLAEQLGLKTDNVPDINDEFLFNSIRQNALKNLGYDVGVFPLKDFKLPQGVKNEFEVGSNEIVFYTNKVLPSTVNPQKFNKGNIVPGVGSTDTVPAMLTPGEFVINKESTKQNYDLLTAINSGKAIGLNKGGMMPGVQYLQEGAPVRKGPGIAGAAAGLAASMLPFAFTDQLGTMGSMAASMVAFSAAQKATTTLVRSYGDEVIKGVGRTKALGMAFQTLGKVALAGMGSWVALGTSIISLGVIFTKINNNIKDGGARLSNAMYGSSESLNKMAEAFGRMTPNQQAIQRQADLAA